MVETEMDDECISCEEIADDVQEGECPNSKRPCGHHCNHSWSHEECCWCGKVFGPIEESPEIELEREIGH